MGSISKIEQHMGSVIEIKLPENCSDLFPFCFDEIKRIEKLYSRFLDDSELSKLNKSLGKWHFVSDETLFLLSKALEIKDKTDGNFDITLKSVLDNLGYDSKYSFKPKETKPSSPISLNPFDKDISLDIKNKKIRLRKEIDFGGFGKGYALDRVASLLNDKSVDHYYINAGGDIYAKRSPGQEPWLILLEHPDNPELAIGKIELDGKSIAGSAPNRRKWGNNHHLINAKTKKPAKGVKAIFVIADTGLEADAYATALFTAGFEDAMGMCMALPVDMLIISSENKIFKTPNFKVEFFPG